MIMSDFICPVCKEKLNKDDKSYGCSSGHCFDISKDGYVNLLMSQQSSLKRHGDDKLMVKSRRDFLSGGYYDKLRDCVCKAVKSSVKEGSLIADVGCGEGFYTSAVINSGEYRVRGIDISKDALRYASKSIKQGEFAVASAFDLPFADKSTDCILNIFAPSPYEEFFRILKDDGVLIKAVPLEDHLWELKRTLYDVPYKNKPEKRDEALFSLVSLEKIKYNIIIDNGEDIENLFRMTPYFYKTGREDANRLLSLSKLETTAHFCVEIYKKR